MHARSPLLAAVALLAGTVGFTGSSVADVSSVGGGAFGASVDVALSAAPPTTAEPVPSVTLPSSGDRVAGSVPSLSVTGEDPSGPFGGRVLQTGTLLVDSHGTTGPAGGATSTASLGDVDALNSFLTATKVASTCTWSESGSVASTTLTGASRVGNQTERVALPTDPEPNTIVTSTLPGSDDVVTVILNEQQVVDGSMVVNAVRIVVDGPSAVGEVVLAQSRCAAVVTAPTSPASTEPSVEPVAEPVDEPVIEPVEPVDEPVIEPVEPGDGTVTEPVDEPVTQAFALPAEGPTETLAASTAEPPTVPARLRTGPAENVQPGPRGTAQLLAAALPVGGPGLFAAQVSEVTGGAFGYHATKIALFGAKQTDRGPEPTVSLPPSGGDESRTAPSADVRFGPAILFTSGPLEVTTQGTTGPTGSVTSTASIQNVNTSGDEVFTAANLSSTCTATGDGPTGSTTINGGTIRTHAQGEDHPEGVVNIPTNPPPGHTVEGHLHIGAAEERFRYVFNEQIRNADGSITVNAAHQYLLGPEAATGELIIGQSRCGVNPTGGTGGTGGAGGARGRLGIGGTDGAGDALGSSGTRGRSGTGGRAGSSGRHLADTGGETPTLLAAALMLAAFTMRRRVRPRPVTGPDGRP